MIPPKKYSMRWTLTVLGATLFWAAPLAVQSQPLDSAVVTA